MSKATSITDYKDMLVELFKPSLCSVKIALIASLVKDDTINQHKVSTKFQHLDLKLCK